ncbi:S-formylglutathione hydrolase FrmB [Pelagirhabdus alkalitolerans]|uniref:S-formylglutathione hydrolase FrmB n=1 Tax=Pelagirhabdus alkalitolerans TaxID=1612202 RepID=A0A1G6GID9_9BACI|nr:alpha/beta hydrolase family protein [Pelagirhabdus alkalitolerans]SDB80946.1 S-formylglutathione hydrolase FrmB [Pelagirhabdus alkalitolerans]
MARITCDFFSEALTLNTSMTVILPEHKTNKLLPTLYLLHGFSDDHTIWTRRTSIERYVSELGIAVVMPNVDHSFYTDMAYGKKYWTFLTEELPQVARSFFPLSDKREDNFVAGLSMGGYGAFKWGLNKPDQFAAIASLSGVLNLAQHPQENTDHPMAQTLYNVFGGDNIEGSMHDIFHLTRKLDQSDEPKPMLYQACGTEDFLFEENIAFKELTDSLSLDVKTTFDSGTHEWGYWDYHIQEVLNWLPLK